MTLTSLTSLSPVQTEQLWRLFQEEWWTKGRSLEDVQALLRHSDFLFGYAETDGTLVAFARALTDHLYRTLLLDVVIAPEYRKKGIGERLMKNILAHPVLSKVESTVLFCRPELVTFYERCGFSAANVGVVPMRISRTSGKVSPSDRPSKDATDRRN